MNRVVPNDSTFRRSAPYNVCRPNASTAQAIERGVAVTPTASLAAGLGCHTSRGSRFAFEAIFMQRMDHPYLSRQNLLVAIREHDTVCHDGVR